MKYAFVTPYYREERALIERCIASVRAQTPQADHILVADGHPQDWIDAQPVRHIRLDRCHADYGNTPRTLGALLAAAEDYAGIAFLDADNWLEPDHLASCLLAAGSTPDCDYVIAQRHLRRPDGTPLPLPDEPVVDHVDTNCLFMLPGSYHIIPHFGLMPHGLAAVGDRIFYAALRGARMRPAVVPHKTVNYLALFASMYARAGETPPPEAKRLDPGRILADWLQQQTPRTLELAGRRAGIRFAAHPVQQPAAPGQRR
ncbi:MAG: glycosyltransferase family A protein [Nevskia sp.]|nr:glycosyltransferase family A protein [Nevskia sp.]